MTTTARTGVDPGEPRIRRPGGSDVDALAALFASRSVDGLRRWSFAPVSARPEDIARNAAQGVGHQVALVADADHRLVGAAGYGRDDSGETAEAWLVIDPAMEQPALAVRLLTGLAAIGCDAGLCRMVLDVHPLDHDLLEAIDDASLRTSRHLHNGMVTVTIHLAPHAGLAGADPIPAGPGALDCRSVVVPVDGSPLAERAMAVGAWLARLLDAELHAATAAQAGSPWWQDRYLAQLQATYGNVRTHRWMGADVAGPVARLADDVGPTVLCAATHGRSRSAPAVGSPFLEIARRTDAPLVAVGERTLAPNRADLPLLACLDGSTESETILPAAATWARRLGCPITLVTVADAAGSPDRAPAGSPKAGDYLTGLLDRPELRSLPVSTEVLSSYVAPHRAIADRLAREPATLVALASRARTGINRMLVGSEAARIIHASPVPIVMQRVGTCD